MIGESFSHALLAESSEDLLGCNDNRTNGFSAIFIESRVEKLEIGFHFVDKRIKRFGERSI